MNGNNVKTLLSLTPRPLSPAYCEMCTRSFIPPTKWVNIKIFFVNELKHPMYTTDHPYYP